MASSEHGDILGQVSLVLDERCSQYGDPTESFPQIGVLWTTLLATKLSPGERVTGSDVALLMAGLKLVRQAYGHKRDNLIDAIGYLAIVDEIAKEKK